MQILIEIAGALVFITLLTGFFIIAVNSISKEK